MKTLPMQTSYKENIVENIKFEIFNDATFFFKFIYILLTSYIPIDTLVKFQEPTVVLQKKRFV